MGTFVGHIVPGLALTFLGLWHTFNTIKAYHRNGKSKFSSRLWYPFHSPIFNFKYLELVLILSFTILAITVQILDFSLLKFTFELANFEHATMFLHLAIYASITLLVELTPSPEIFTGLVGVLTASVFSQELFLLHFHSTDHVGLEGHYHWLLQIIVLVSFISVVGVTTCPNCFVAALTLSVSVVFQGCWLMNMGFMLWVPSFVPKGCIVTLADGLHDMHGAVMCETDEAFHRAIALANLQFSWILAGNLILVACLCLTLSRKCFQKNQFIDYEQLQCKAAVQGI